MAWKAELLSAAGADVDVFGKHPCEELRTMAAQAPRGAGEARKMLVDPAGDPRKQDEGTALMIALAKAGKRVVGLRSGEPVIVGRAGDEIAACPAAGIALEVVAGTIHPP